MNVDKAGKTYWDDLWAEQSAISKHPSVAHVEKRFRRCFASIFKDFDARGARLLEAGCGASFALPHLANDFGFFVTGLDYSRKACERARANLIHHQTAGEVICADFFHPPEDLKESFDVVLSSGVVEHFTETADCIRSLASFVKPGGLMITFVPNLTGICGTIQRVFNRPVFDLHVPLDRKALAIAHEKAGLDVIACEYFMSTNFGIVNLRGVSGRGAGVKRVVLALLTRLSYAIWLAEGLVRPLPPNRFSSPYVNCIARKPE